MSRADRCAGYIGSVVSSLQADDEAKNCLRETLWRARASSDSFSVRLY